jgi:hypothetical protein
MLNKYYLLLTPFPRWRNWDSHAFSDFLQITRLLSDRDPLIVYPAFFPFTIQNSGFLKLKDILQVIHSFTYYPSQQMFNENLLRWSDTDPGTEGGSHWESNTWTFAGGERVSRGEIWGQCFKQRKQSVQRSWDRNLAFILEELWGVASSAPNSEPIW